MTGFFGFAYLQCPVLNFLNIYFERFLLFVSFKIIGFGKK